MTREQMRFELVKATAQAIAGAAVPTGKDYWSAEDIARCSVAVADATLAQMEVEEQPAPQEAKATKS